MKKYLLTATAVLIVLLDLSVLTTVSASKEYLSVDGVNTNLETSNLSEATKALTEEDKVEFIGLSDAEIDSKEIDISESYNGRKKSTECQHINDKIWDKSYHDWYNVSRYSRFRRNFNF